MTKNKYWVGSLWATWREKIIILKREGGSILHGVIEGRSLQLCRALLSFSNLCDFLFLVYEEYDSERFEPRAKYFFENKSSFWFWEHRARAWTDQPRSVVCLVEVALLLLLPLRSSRGLKIKNLSGALNYRMGPVLLSLRDKRGDRCLFPPISRFFKSGLFGAKLPLSAPQRINFQCGPTGFFEKADYVRFPRDY